MLSPIIYICFGSWSCWPPAFWWVNHGVAFSKCEAALLLHPRPNIRNAPTTGLYMVTFLPVFLGFLGQVHLIEESVHNWIWEFSKPFLLVWPVPLAQVWTHYKIGKLNMWTLFCNVCIDFLNSQIWMDIMLEMNSNPSSVTTFSTDFSFQNLVFGNLFEFSVAEITLKSISPTFWIQILPNKFH